MANLFREAVPGDQRRIVLAMVWGLEGGDTKRRPKVLPRRLVLYRRLYHLAASHEGLDAPERHCSSDGMSATACGRNRFICIQNNVATWGVALKAGNTSDQSNLEETLTGTRVREMHIFEVACLLLPKVHKQAIGEQGEVAVLERLVDAGAAFAQCPFAVEVGVRYFTWLRRRLEDRLGEGYVAGTNNTQTRGSKKLAGK